MPAERPSSLRQISGEDALMVHLKDAEEQKAASENGSQSVLLGERALSSGHTTIAEVLHSDTSSTPISPEASTNSQQLAHRDDA